MRSHEESSMWRTDASFNIRQLSSTTSYPTLSEASFFLGKSNNMHLEEVLMLLLLSHTWTILLFSFLGYVLSNVNGLIVQKIRCTQRASFSL